MTSRVIHNEIVKPDYHGGGIVNLMASVSLAFGATPKYEPLVVLSPEELAEPRNVVLLVIDGLGANFLDKFPGSFLRQHLRARITSVFPSTTASAISTFVSGLAPAQHGVVGWFTFLKELGSIATMLPFKPRHGGPTYPRMGIDPRIVFTWEPLFNRLDARTYVVTRHDLADSTYSIVTSGKALRCAYENWDGCLDCIKDVLNRPGGERQYVYAYWPALDSLGHQFGIDSAAAYEHFLDLDGKIAEFAEAAIGSDTVFIVCADHGLVDTSAEQTIHLEAHPELADALTLPLTGEPRATYCHVRAARHQAFVQYLNDNLSAACWCLDSGELVRSEDWFGPGTPHPALLHRVGDYTVLMRGTHIIKDQLPTEQPFQQVGVHGGLSADEVYVPLIVIRL